MGPCVLSEKRIVLSSDINNSDGFALNKLDSDLLRTFLAVADAGTVTGGAARIYRSQSAASVQIKQLEDLLGQPVFKRHGRGVVLSRVGEVLEPVARQVIQALDAAMAEITGGGLEGSLRIGRTGRLELDRGPASYERARRPSASSLHAGAPCLARLFQLHGRPSQVHPRSAQRENLWSGRNAP